MKRRDLVHKVYIHSGQTRNMGQSVRLNPADTVSSQSPWRIGGGGGGDAGGGIPPGGGGGGRGRGGGGGEGRRCGLWYLGLYTHLREIRCNFPERNKSFPPRHCHCHHPLTS